MISTSDVLIFAGLVLIALFLVNMAILRWIFRIDTIVNELKMIRKKQTEVSKMEVDAMQQGFNNRAEWSDATFSEIQKIHEILQSMSSPNTIDQSVKDTAEVITPTVTEACPYCEGLIGNSDTFCSHCGRQLFRPLQEGTISE